MPIITNHNLELIKNIIQKKIIPKIFKGEPTADDILDFLDVYNDPAIGGKFKECFDQAVESLDKEELHEINAAIMRHSNSILHGDDANFMLRTSDFRLILLLLRKEGELFGMQWLFDQEGNFIVPEIPPAILDHYATLKEHFYLERQSYKSLDTRIASSVTWIFYNHAKMLVKNIQGVVEQSLQGEKLMKLLNDMKDAEGQYVVNLVESKISQSCKHIEPPEEQALFPSHKIDKHIDNMTKALIPVLVQEIIEQALKKVGSKNIIELKAMVMKYTDIQPTLAATLTDQLQAAYFPELIDSLLQHPTQIIELITNNLPSSKVPDKKVEKVSDDIATSVLKHLTGRHFQSLGETMKDKNDLAAEDNVIARNHENSKRVKHDDSGIFNEDSVAKGVGSIGEVELMYWINLGY